MEDALHTARCQTGTLHHAVEQKNLLNLEMYFISRLRPTFALSYDFLRNDGNNSYAAYQNIEEAKPCILESGLAKVKKVPPYCCDCLIGKAQGVGPPLASSEAAHRLSAVALESPSRFPQP